MSLSSTSRRPWELKRKRIRGGGIDGESCTGEEKRMWLGERRWQEQRPEVGRAWTLKKLGGIIGLNQRTQEYRLT